MYLWRELRRERDLRRENLEQPTVAKEVAFAGGVLDTASPQGNLMKQPRAPNDAKDGI